MSRARVRASLGGSALLAVSVLLGASCEDDSRPARAECVGAACTTSESESEGSVALPPPAGAGAPATERGGMPGATDPELVAPDGMPLVPSGEPAPDGTAVTPAGPTPREASSTAQLDLLLVIDNAATMGDKQELLSRSLPALVQRLVDPECTDERGRRSLAPAGQGCPPGLRRVFAPLEDINVAVISSSLGDAGAGVDCAGGERDERAHSIASLPRGANLGASAAGVLELRRGGDVAAFTASLSALVAAVGQGGCDWNMPLEAMYRFLADPRPYLRLERGACGADTPGDGDCVRPAAGADGALLVDEQLLEQRAAFLRPDSELAVVLVSDENDCSVQLQPQSYVVLDTAAPEPMTRPSTMCEFDPSDPCCYSCAEPTPEGCFEDDDCDALFGLPRLDPLEDPPSLRCFEQKRRFGVDYLYPTQRYVNALSQSSLCLERADLDMAECLGNWEANPLFVGGRTSVSTRGVPLGNPINGRDYGEAFVRELQATCLMPLPEPRDCALAPAGGACECAPTTNSRPVCEEQPGLSLAGTTQYWAKALPSLCQLVVLRDHGQHAAVTSICARNTRAPELGDYGYRPALMAVIERLQARLATYGAAQ